MMPVSENHASKNLPDLDAFAANLPAELFQRDKTKFVARAPGRLDVMGGIADYSGSHVLELTIAEAIRAAAQRRDDDFIKIRSGDREFQMPVADLREMPDYESARRYFQRRGEDWAAYAGGIFHVLMREKELDPAGGASIYIESDVPEGKGVSSSAALESAVMFAVAAAFDIELERREAAFLCQKVENLIVGAPCGIMDQMSVICGRRNEFLSMVCRPAEVLAPVAIPDDLAFWGIDSGIRHSVGGGDYGTVRAGAFIGYRMIADWCGFSVRIENGRAFVDDDRWNGYLSAIEVDEFSREFLPRLPVEISGREFLGKFGATTDHVTRIDPAITYAVRNPTAHPVFENARVLQFGSHIGNGSTAARELGQIMYAAHESYSSCGLDSDGTDLIVDLVRKLGGDELFGAKITGGGSGGTVAVIGRVGAADAVVEIAAKYEEMTGFRPYVFSGSSPGAFVIQK